MSIKKEYEVKTHTVTERVCVKETTCCDVCEREIETNTGYWTLVTGHNDWGNDSYESIENFDICSEDCLRKKFDEYVLHSMRTNHNTEYFEIGRSRR